MAGCQGKGCWENVEAAKQALSPALEAHIFVLGDLVYCQGPHFIQALWLPWIWAKPPRACALPFLPCLFATPLSLSLSFSLSPSHTNTHICWSATALIHPPAPSLRASCQTFVSCHGSRRREKERERQRSGTSEGANNNESLLEPDVPHLQPP